ncbi:MAG: glycosyltransferase [Myxococcota bacterium]
MARILVVTNTDFFMRLFLEPLVGELDRRGHAVELCCNGEALGPALSGYPHHPFDFPSRPAPMDFLRAGLRMRRLLQRGRFDLVNSHNRNASIVARSAAAGTGIHSVYTANGYYFNDAQGPGAYAASVALETALGGVTSLTLSQTEEDANLMRRWRLAPRDRIRVIGNGVDLERFRPAEGRLRAKRERELGLPSGRFRFIAVGRLVEGKGFQDLLEAFARLAGRHMSIELLQVGGNIAQDISPFQAAYQERVQALGLGDRVLMTGMTAQVPAYLSVSDVYVTPSYWEGLSRSLLEGMAMGLPVLATQIRGAREVVRHGQNGYLYPPHDVRSLTELMERMVMASMNERLALGQAARSDIVRSFELKDYTDRQADAIDAVLEGLVSRN